jgi:hypothetical protein
MPRRRVKRKKSEGTHSMLIMKVSGYDAELDFSVNMDVYQPQYAISPSDDDPLFKASSDLRIRCVFIEPEDRVGNKVVFHLFGDGAVSRKLNITLKDAQCRGKHNEPLYKTYRGREIPIYKPPKGLSVLEKVRGEPEWNAWIRVPTELISDMLALLGQREELYVAIHEWKFERRRWIRSISVRTTDPLEE